MIDKSVSRMDKYKEFYFGKQYHLSDLEKTNLLILHNSWTPDWYKELTVEEVLTHSCTMSNVLREAL